MATDQNHYTKFNNAVMSLYTDSDEVARISEQLYRLSMGDHNQELMALALILRGNLRFIKGEYSKAANYYHQCKKILIYIKNDYYKGYYYKSVADIHLKNDDYVLSLSYYYDALKAILYEEDMFKIALKVNCNIGYIYMELEVYDKAYSYYQKVMKLAEESHDESLLSLTYSNIGYCMLKTNQRFEATNYLELGHEFAVKYSATADEAYSKYLYGHFYSQIKDYKKAQQVLAKALDFYKKEGNEFWQGRIMTEIGNAYIKEHDYVKAEDILLRCQLLIKGNAYRSVEFRVIGLLGCLYEAKEDYKKSLYYYKHYYKLKESFDRYWKTIQIEAIVTHNRGEEEQLAIKELEHDKRVLQSLSAVGRRISASLDFNSIVDTIRNNIFGLTSGDILIIGIRQTNQIKYKVFGRNFMDEGTVAYDNQVSPIARFMHHNEITILEQLKDKPPIAEPERLKKEHLNDLNNIMSNPLLNQSQHVGTVIIGRYGKVPFVKRDKELVGLLSAYVSVAIQNWIQSDELIKRNVQLKDLTEKDGLTGAYNRYALKEHMKQYDNKWGNRGQHMAVVMIDIDYFKEYNDHYGHQEGDQVLKTVSGIIRSRILGFNARAYRYGGDEFMLIVSNRSMYDITGLCEAIRIGVVRQHIIHETSKASDYVTLTIGAVTSNKSYNKVADLIGLADKALYEAKGRGRNNTQQMTIE